MPAALAPARRRRRIVIPAPRRAPRETLLTALPFFLRGAAAPGAARPPLLSFEGPGFLEDFLAAAGDAARLPRLLPWRDWAEPPAGVLDAVGAPLYPASLAREAPLAIERDPGLGPGGDGVPAGTPPWLRKLYLPLHARFTLLAFDVICQAPGWPRLARGRVLAAGAVVRRLRPDPARERWEDWISADGKRGVWIELAAPLEAAGDPEALNAAAFAGLETALRARLGLSGTAPLPARLDSAKLALLPPDAAEGRAAAHTTLYGYLPVHSAAEQAPETAVTSPAAVAAALEAKAAAAMAALAASAPALAARIAPALRDLLAETVRPGGGGDLNTAWTSIAWWTSGDLEGSRAEAEAALERVTESFLREAWRRLEPSGRDGNAITGQVPATHAWLDEAEAALRGVALTSAGLSAFGSAWLASTFANRSAAWRVILEARLRQGIAALAGEAPPPGPAPSPAFTPAQRDLLLGCALLRLRQFRLSLAASLRVQMFGAEADTASLARTRNPPPPGVPIPVTTPGGLGQEIAAAFALEAARGTDQPPPWPPLDRRVPRGAAGDERAFRAHRAALALEEAFADFEAAAAEAGAGFEERQDAALRARAAALAVAAGMGPATEAQRLRWVRAHGLEMREQPARGLFAAPGPAPMAATLAALGAEVAAVYRNEAKALGLARAEARAPRPRYDSQSLYCVQAWVRVAGRDACERAQVIWTPRSEPFSLAEPTDVLGVQPAAIALPDIPKLIRDIPRIAKARARPYAGFAAPPDSGYVTGEEPGETERASGIGFVCSFAIPALTICAYILFSIVFAILVLLPGFAWMLLLKFCLPIPVPRKR